VSLKTRLAVRELEDRPSFLQGAEKLVTCTRWGAAVVVVVGGVVVVVVGGSVVVVSSAVFAGSVVGNSVVYGASEVFVASVAAMFVSSPAVPTFPPATRAPPTSLRAAHMASPERPALLGVDLDLRRHRNTAEVMCPVAVVQSRRNPCGPRPPYARTAVIVGG
jgi:hypothetical protein